MSHPAPARPASRYGTEASPGGSRGSSGIAGKVIAVLAVVALIVAAVLLGRSMMQRDSSPVEMSLVTQERQNDSLITVWVDVTRDDVSQPSYCIVTALNYAMAEVGRREILMPPGGEQNTRVGVDVPTRDVAVAGGVYGCSTEMAPYMDVDNPVNSF